MPQEGLEQHIIDAKLRSNVSPVYISPEGEPYQSYMPGNSETQQELRSIGLDHNFAAHLSYFLRRDPLLLERDHLGAHGSDDTYHFRSSYRCSWPHVRLKFPEGEASGWKVEFRPMEVQLTDFENAAFIVFLVLLRHAMAHYMVQLYIPMHCVVENMQTAVKRNAVTTEEYWFRASGPLRWDDQDGRPRNEARCQDSGVKETGRKGAAQRLSLEEIFCGSSHDRFQYDMARPDDFPGLVPLIKRYLKDIAVSNDEWGMFLRYLDFIEGRASGKLWTNARWMRHTIQSHSSYQHDGLVTQDACYDLCCKIRDLSST